MSPLWIVLTLLPIIGGAERFNCRGRILGAYYADAKSGCKAFHVCVRVAGGGIRDFRFFCPPGTLFHQEAQTCTDWGDDDPLACPADIYDGQFDIYKIGSGFDTKKVSSSASRDDEAEFGLQRADSGDRRLSQSHSASNSGASDLRTAYSSDFFTGQRERGREEPSPPSSASPSSRQSYRRPVTSRPPPTTQYTPTVPTTTPPTSPAQRDVGSKRKLVRKRPIYVSTPPPKQEQSSPPQQFTWAPQQNFDRKNIPQNNPAVQPVSIPPHYKDYQDEYVEVSRVTPKPKATNGQTYSATFTQPTSTPQHNKKETLIEVYNYNAQTNPNFKGKADNHAYKFKNNFNVSPNVPNETNLRGNIQISSNGASDASTTSEFDTASPKTFASSTPSYRNLNSVSYESEKKSYNSFSSPKQTYFSSPVTTQSTSTLPTTRSEVQRKFNTAAYNTNIGINVQFSDNVNEEDDGQYRPPAGEDDGQYRPELYERELLFGAHSLNIAASGNRLPEDQRPRAKTQSPKAASQASPRPFRPVPTTSLPVKQTSIPESFTTTSSPQTADSRTFDYFQTYTTTSRPSDIPGPSFDVDNRAPERLTTSTPRVVETRLPGRVPPRAASPPTLGQAPSRPTTRAPHFARPANNKEDTSYDYAYYDSDPGFSEYEHIEEFGKTKRKV